MTPTNETKTCDFPFTKDLEEYKLLVFINDLFEKHFIVGDSAHHNRLMNFFEVLQNFIVENIEDKETRTKYYGYIDDTKKFVRNDCAKLTQKNRSERKVVLANRFLYGLIPNPELKTFVIENFVKNTKPISDKKVKDYKIMEALYDMFDKYLVIGDQMHKHHIERFFSLIETFAKNNIEAGNDRANIHKDIVEIKRTTEEWYKNLTPENIVPAKDLITTSLGYLLDRNDKFRGFLLEHFC